MDNDVSHVQSQTPPPPIIPATTPPLITPPPPPGPPRKGSGWMKVAVVLGILLLLSVLSNLGHLIHSVTVKAKGGRPARAHLEEVTYENNHSKNKIALLDIGGVITNQTWGRGGRRPVGL